MCPFGYLAASPVFSSTVPKINCPNIPVRQHFGVNHPLHGALTEESRWNNDTVCVFFLPIDTGVPTRAPDVVYFKRYLPVRLICKSTEA